MSVSPNVLSGWLGLMSNLSKTLDVKTRDSIALAVSQANGCNYCLAAHSYAPGSRRCPGRTSRSAGRGVRRIPSVLLLPRLRSE
jgi:alkylhydroperoxidase family enzyme